MNNQIPTVFIDSDKPELVCGIKTCDCPKPQPPKPKEYHQRPTVINRPYSDMPVPGPYVPDYETLGTEPASPIPVPNTYLAPGHHCHNHHKPECHCHPDHNIHPFECHDDGPYVTKHELNHILAHIADADIFRDLSEEGTTVSVGGIKKGTKLDSMTFARFVKLMMYPDLNMDDEEYACETDSGRTVLNSTVKTAIGDLKVGDSLKGMTVSQILEAMLCGKNKWGTYLWKSDVTSVEAGTTTLDAETLFPKLVEDYDWRHTYELLVVCKNEDKESEDKFVYNELIANIYNKDQKTNVSIEGVPADLKWSYNPESKKITLHTDTEITTAIAVVLVRR